jgi:hypothetical protein
MEVNFGLFLDFGKALVGPLTYNITGWLKNSAEDGEFQDYEIKQGLATMLAVTLKTAVVFFGLSMFASMDVNLVASGFIGVAWQMVEKYFKDKKAKVVAKK